MKSLLRWDVLMVPGVQRLQRAQQLYLVLALIELQLTCAVLPPLGLVVVIWLLIRILEDQSRRRAWRANSYRLLMS